jgi:hypothetical protein
MAYINPAEFESLWEGVKNRPLVRAAKAAPISADLSLTGILNHYMTMAGKHREQGKISQQDYDDLQTAVNNLKAVLARINDSAMVADAAAENAAAIEVKMRAKTSGT